MKSGIKLAAMVTTTLFMVGQEASAKTVAATAPNLNQTVKVVDPSSVAAEPTVSEDKIQECMAKLRISCEGKNYAADVCTVTYNGTVAISSSGGSIESEGGPSTALIAKERAYCIRKIGIQEEGLTGYVD